MKAAKTRGAHFESLACHYLQQQGLNLIVQNYQTKLGEIDLILQDGSEIVFCEVRFRAKQDYGGALESITWQKQKKIIRTAQLFLQKHPAYQQTSCRFDVIALSDNPSKQADLTWLKNAFQINC